MTTADPQVQIPPGKDGSLLYPWRIQTAIAIILLMAVLAVCTLASYYSLLRRTPANEAGIRMDEGRFRDLRAILPSRGTVGYLGEPGSTEENVRAYYLTQYFLAPVVIAPDTNHELVVANFASAAAIARIAAAGDFTVANDFSNGLALLRKVSR